jgi:hypothetical protein
MQFCVCYYCFHLLVCVIIVSTYPKNFQKTFMPLQVTATLSSSGTNSKTPTERFGICSDKGAEKDFGNFLGRVKVQLVAGGITVGVDQFVLLVLIIVPGLVPVFLQPH